MCNSNHLRTDVLARGRNCKLFTTARAALSLIPRDVKRMQIIPTEVRTVPETTGCIL